MRALLCRFQVTRPNHQSAYIWAESAAQADAALRAQGINNFSLKGREIL